MVLDVFLWSVDFSVMEESGYYEWLYQELPLVNIRGPVAFADPVGTSPILGSRKAVSVELIKTEAGKGWIVMICRSKAGLDGGCNKSAVSSCRTESPADILGRGFVVCECFLDLELPGMLAIQWGRKTAGV